MVKEQLQLSQKVEVKKPITDCVVRITSNEAEPDADLFAGNTHLAIVKEGGNADVSQHFHCYVSGLKIETLRSRLKKMYKGNKQFSCKIVVEKENQLRYLFKGEENTKPVVLVNTYDVDVDEQWKRFWQDRKAYKEVVKEKKKSTLSLRDQVKENVQKDRVEGKYGWHSTRNIIFHILEICKEKDVAPPRDDIIMSIIQYVRLTGGEAEVEEQLIEVMLQRISQKLSYRT